MTDALLDVNVLLALAWPNHQFHSSARRWFADHEGAWCTCVVTQLGFVRLSSNPAFTDQAKLPAEVDWAYTTIRSVLARLEEKGAVKEYKRSNVSFYEPILTVRKARMAALQSVVGDAFEGAFGPLVHFLVEEEALSEQERQRLMDVLEGEGGQGGADD